MNMKHYHTLLVYGEELAPVIKTFTERVYHRGLQAIIDASRKKGMSGECGGVTLRSYCIAGRIMLTFTRGEAQVSFVGAEHENPPRFGLQSCEGGLFVARDLITAYVDAWPAQPAQQRAVHRDDEDVALSVGGMRWP